jgi:hypothetical protein
MNVSQLNSNLAIIDNGFFISRVVMYKNNNYDIVFVSTLYTHRTAVISLFFEFFRQFNSLCNIGRVRVIIST